MNKFDCINNDNIKDKNGKSLESFIVISSPKSH